jgi:hypothetical protein
MGFQNLNWIKHQSHHLDERSFKHYRQIVQHEKNCGNISFFGQFPFFCFSFCPNENNSLT